jgi:hypothetical protein
LLASAPFFLINSKLCGSLREYRPFARTPIVERVVEELQHVPIVINHGIATSYRSDVDHIGPHNDKIHDIQPHSYIASLSFGETRAIQPVRRCLRLGPAICSFYRGP